MKLHKSLVFLGLFLIHMYSVFAATVQDAFTSLADIFSDFDIYEIYQIAPRFVDFLIVLVLLLRVMKFEKVVKALGGGSAGKKTGTIIAIVLSFSVFAVPSQYGLSTLAIGVLGLFALSFLIATTVAGFVCGKSKSESWAGRAFYITLAMLIFGGSMKIFGGGDLNGLQEVSPVLAGLVELIYGLGFLSLVFVWPAIFGKGGDNDALGKSPDFNNGDGFIDKLRRVTQPPDPNRIKEKDPTTVPVSETGEPIYYDLNMRLNREVQKYEHAIQNNANHTQLEEIEKKIESYFYDIVNSGEIFTKISNNDYNTLSHIIRKFAELKKIAVETNGARL